MGVRSRRMLSCAGGRKGRRGRVFGGLTQTAAEILRYLLWDQVYPPHLLRWRSHPAEISITRFEIGSRGLGAHLGVGYQSERLDDLGQPRLVGAATKEE